MFVKHGVKVNTFNIMALPTENAFEVDLKTLDLNLILKPNFASFGLLYPFQEQRLLEWQFLEVILKKIRIHCI